MIWIIYILCVIYCLYQLQKRYRKQDLGGGIGVSPGLDVIMVIMLAPFLTLVDVTLTWIRIYKEAEEARIRNSKKVL
jgi:hypothetical protein